jgi:hypothetical protein
VTCQHWGLYVATATLETVPPHFSRASNEKMHKVGMLLEMLLQLEFLLPNITAAGAAACAELFENIVTKQPVFA